MNEKLIKACTKEQLEDLYVNKSLSLAVICKEVGLCPSSIKQLIEYYQLTRDPKAAQKLHLEKIAQQKRDNRKVVSAEELRQYYIVENHPYEETAKHFNLSPYALDNYIREYDLKKDRHISGKMGLEKKYSQAGNKDKYDQQVKAKADATKIKKAGSIDNFYAQRQQKIEQTNLERYGYKYKATADLVGFHSEKYAEVWGSLDKSIEYLNSFTDRPTTAELAENLNASINCIHLWIEKYNLGSYIKITKTHYETEIIDFIQQLGFNVDRNNREILDGQEIDIYIPEKQLAIEFNGNYWHSSSKVSPQYHYKRSFGCEQKGIRLIHIYQYQWENPIKQKILKSIITNALGKNENIIYARKCELKELKKKDVEEFSINNSLHGHRNASIYLGLFYNDELVELMSFGKAFFSRDDSIDYECIRSITKINTTVVGGMNKLFKYFINKWQPEKILYYVDYNTHVGNSMPKLGFEFNSYSKGGIVNLANCKEVREKFGDVFNRKPMKNKEIQTYIAQGKVLSIYDAGVKKYIWKNPAKSCISNK